MSFVGCAVGRRGERTADADGRRLHRHARGVERRDLAGERRRAGAVVLRDRAGRDAGVQVHVAGVHDLDRPQLVGLADVAGEDDVLRVLEGQGVVAIDGFSNVIVPSPRLPVLMATLSPSSRADLNVTAVPPVLMSAAVITPPVAATVTTPVLTMSAPSLMLL
ncbi:MAG: hypothetical protein QM796_10395 [Chthoniobacteraceae bacterium]